MGKNECVNCCPSGHPGVDGGNVLSAEQAKLILVNIYCWCASRNRLYKYDDIVSWIFAHPNDATEVKLRCALFDKEWNHEISDAKEMYQFVTDKLEKLNE